MLGEEKTKTLFLRYMEAMNARVPENIIALFDDNASVNDPVGKPPYEGIEAISEFYHRVMALQLHLELDGEVVTTFGNTAAAAINVTSPKFNFRIIETLSFNDDGQIVEMRAHYGPTAMGA